MFIDQNIIDVDQTTHSKQNTFFNKIKAQNNSFDDLIKLQGNKIRINQKRNVKTIHSKDKNLLNHTHQEQLQYTQHSHIDSNLFNEIYQDTFQWEKQKFSKFFKTSAMALLKNREYAYKKHRKRLIDSTNYNSVNEKRVTGIDFKKQTPDRMVFKTTNNAYSEQRFVNFHPNFTPKNNIVPIDKMKPRQFSEPKNQSPDKNYDYNIELIANLKYDQSNVKCYINLGRNTRPLDKLKKENIFKLVYHNNSLNYDSLKKRSKTFSNFLIQQGRNKLTPCQRRQMKESQISYIA